MPRSIQSDFTSAGAIITVATTMITGIVAFLPVDAYFNVPPSLYLHYQLITGVSWLFIALIIAVRSYQTDFKSKLLSIRYAGFLFFVGIVCAGFLVSVSENWTIHDPACIDPVTKIERRDASTLIAPANLSEKLVDLVVVQKPTIERNESTVERDVRAALPLLICEDEAGADIHRAISETNNGRETVFLAALVIMATGIFSGITLILWSLIALQPVDDQDRNQEQHSFSEDLIAMLRMLFTPSK